MILHAYNSANREQLENYLIKSTYKFMKEFVEIQAQGLNVSEDDKFFIESFYQHAIVGITLEWIGSGMKENPEIHINKMEKLFSGSIKIALEKASKK